jgi:predicted permease
MGASRWRVVRQLLIESLVLALLGGILAVTITAWTAESLAGFVPPTGSPITLNGTLDMNVLAATLLMSVLTSLVFGVVPALRTSTVPPASVLNEETGRSSGGSHKGRLAGTLVVAQIALSLLLLLCAGLFVRSLVEVHSADAGFTRDGVALASYDLSTAGYSATTGREFHRQLLAKLRAVPGVESVSLADWVPLTFTKRTDVVEPEGYVPRPQESLDLRRATVGPDYFRTMQIAMVSGRDLTDQDTETSMRVATVNQAFAGRYWPGQDPLGKRLRARGQWFTVVGVARNSSQHRVSDLAEPMYYVPLLQDYRTDVIIHARVAGDPGAFAGRIRRLVAEMNPALTVWDVTTLSSTTRLSSIFERLAATFVGTLGILALTLASVGIYGVVAYATRLRTREIGIRAALGAGRADVFLLVTGRGFKLAAIGLSVGLAVAVAASRALRGLLFGVSETDVATYLSVSAILCVVVLVACSIPAWRVMRREPLDALRDQ